MKKYTVSLALGLMMIAGLSACFHHRHHNDMSIRVSEDEDEFEMEADYRKKQTHDVQVYLNNRLLSNSSVRFNEEDFVDKEITLDDNTTFYINTNPGELNIRIDKNENSEESCERVKRFCKGLEIVLKDN